MLPIQIPSSTVVKDTVKAALKDKFLSATLAANVPLFLFLTISLLSGIWLTVFSGKWALVSTLFMAISLVFLIFPIILGTVRYFWRLTQGDTENPTGVFYYFNNLFIYKRALKCAFLLGFRLVITFFVSLLPYFIVVLLSESWLYRFLGTEVPFWVAGLVMLESFLQIAGIFIGFLFSLRYYLVLPLTVMDDNMLLLEAFHLSVTVSRRSAGAFVGLLFSILGYIFLSFFLLPTIYTLPLIIGSYALHSRYAIVNYNQNLEYNKNQFKETL